MGFSRNDRAGPTAQARHRIRDARKKAVSQSSRANPCPSTNSGANSPTSARTTDCGRQGMSYKVDEIEGIGGAIAQKLAAAGIKTTDALLEAC